jgi:hypothetical protein
VNVAALEARGRVTAWPAVPAMEALDPATSTSSNRRRMVRRTDLVVLTREGFDYLARNPQILGLWLICAVGGASVVGSVVVRGWLDGQSTLAVWLALLMGYYLGFVKGA